jgi:hypothetical protein
MWRCELNLAGSVRTELHTFEEMEVILWLHKAGALYDHQSGRSCRRRRGIIRRGCRWYLTREAIWGAHEACVRFVHRH